MNDAPLLTGTQATLLAGTEDTAFTVTAAQLLEGFADPEGTALVLSDLSVDHGTIVGDGAGDYTVTPAADYNGPLVISYSVGDGAASIPATLSTTLEAVNDAPVLTQPVKIEVAESAAPGTVFATLAATDVDDAGSALRYTITAGNADGLFTIDPVTGVVTLAAGQHLDYETAPSHALTVVATDAAGLAGVARTLIIDVTDLNEATGIVTTASRAGTLKAGDTVTFTLETETAVAVTGAPRLTLSNGATATYAGLDGEGRATFTYTIADGEDDASLTVTGLELNGGSLDMPGLLDFAAAPNVTVGGAPASVTVADVNEDGKLDILTANNSSNTGFGAAGRRGRRLQRRDRRIR